MMRSRQTLPDYRDFYNCGRGCEEEAVKRMACVLTIKINKRKHLIHITNLIFFYGSFFIYAKKAMFYKFLNQQFSYLDKVLSYFCWNFCK